MVDIECFGCGEPVDAGGGKCPHCGMRQMTLPWVVLKLLAQPLVPVVVGFVYAVLLLGFPDVFGHPLAFVLVALGTVGLMAFNVVVIFYRFGRRRRRIRRAKRASAGGGEPTSADGSRESEAASGPGGGETSRGTDDDHLRGYQ